VHTCKTLSISAKDHFMCMQIGVKQLPCPGASCKARYCPRCGGAEHKGTLCSPDTQVRQVASCIRNPYASVTCAHRL
jgi:hypothetical protein